MIIPETRYVVARVPLSHIVLTEHQVRYPARVLHYLRLLTAPGNERKDTGPVTLAPHHRGKRGEQYFTPLDGHHRYLAHVLAGRSAVLALIEIEPGQDGYARAVPALDLVSSALAATAGPRLDARMGHIGAHDRRTRPRAPETKGAVPTWPVSRS
ncbi:MAG: hypothetical protein IVW57_00255 [Ktedonobacterales bacterium]|nr:hypothetical protein [Ktedonobacterales bacterium]